MACLPKGFYCARPKRPVLNNDKWLNWKHSKDANRNIKNWSTIREAILERDRFECRICHRSDCEMSLHVHHKDWDRTNNQDNNLVTLCQACHRQVHNEGYKPSLYLEYPEPWGDEAVNGW